MQTSLASPDQSCVVSVQPSAASFGHQHLVLWLSIGMWQQVSMTRDLDGPHCDDPATNQRFLSCPLPATDCFDAPLHPMDNVPYALMPNQPQHTTQHSPPGFQQPPQGPTQSNLPLRNLGLGSAFANASRQQQPWNGPAEMGPSVKPDPGPFNPFVEHTREGQPFVGQPAEQEGQLPLGAQWSHPFRQMSLMASLVSLPSLPDAGLGVSHLASAGAAICVPLLPPQDMPSSCRQPLETPCASLAFPAVNIVSMLPGWSRASLPDFALHKLHACCLLYTGPWQQRRSTEQDDRVSCRPAAPTTPPFKTGRQGASRTLLPAHAYQSSHLIVICSCHLIRSWSRAHACCHRILPRSSRCPCSISCSSMLPGA